MEKRALLAFILSLAVLFFWEYYFGLFRSTPPQTPGTEQTAPPPAQDPPKPPVSTALPAPPSLPQERPLELGERFAQWTVDTPLVRTQFLAPGARIQSFQLKNFRQEIEKNSPPMELITTQSSGYLPLAVDLLQHPNWQLSTRPFVSQSPPLVTLSDSQATQSLAFQTEVPDQVRVTKTFAFAPNSYTVDVAIQVHNLSSAPLTDQLGVSFYFQPYSEPDKESSYNPSQVAAFEQGSHNVYALKDLAKQEVTFKPPMAWVGYENNFFLQAIVPIASEGYRIVPRFVDPNRGLVQMVYLTDPFQIEAGQQKDFSIRLYLGPKELSYLNQAEHQLSQSVDYGWFTFLAKPLLHVLNWLYKYLHNYGLAIIVITILIKIVFWPLTQKSYESMQKMKKIQPKIAQVREKYKDDKEKLNKELMAVYSTYKVNPMGGCLPMVLQIPVFFALYRMLNGAVELRHEPFVWWINDLTAPDRLFIGVPIPYLGGLPVLTILMGVSMFIQQKMTPTGGDPRQEQIMLLMPVIFTVFFINFPSGLVLYWLVNNVLSIAQQYWVNRHA